MPLTSEQAGKLNDVLYKREPFEVVSDWLCEHADKTWGDYSQLLAERLQDRNLALAREDFLDWQSAADSARDSQIPGSARPFRFPIIVRYVTKRGRPDRPDLQSGKACPQCDARSDTLEWAHMYVEKQYGLLAGHGWIGWVSVCVGCELRVDKVLDRAWII